MPFPLSHRGSSVQSVWGGRPPSFPTGCYYLVVWGFVRLQNSPLHAFFLGGSKGELSRRGSKVRNCWSMSETVVPDRDTNIVAARPQTQAHSRPTPGKPGVPPGLRRRGRSWAHPRSIDGFALSSYLFVYGFCNKFH